MNIINSSNIAAIAPFFQHLHFPSPDSHKGQNGKLMVIGGSSLFHSASIWAAEIASYFADMVHYCSTRENANVMLSLKQKFQNGIVIHQQDLPVYISEDDVVLIGPGMMRGEVESFKSNCDFSDVLKIQTRSESSFTYYLSQYVFSHYPDKKFVIDAGALQMMDKKWLLHLKTKPILTPHIKEYASMFGLNPSIKKRDEIILHIVSMAKHYHCIMMVKLIDDIITDGDNVYVVKGGNPGLTKGGTGDILAGLTASFYTYSDPLISALVASFVLKTSADELFKIKGTWYNNDDIIDMIPHVLNQIHKLRG